MSLTNQLKALIDQTDLVVTELQIDLLISYVELLHKWNKAYNLTSVRDPQEMLIKHIMDSLMVSPLLKGASFIDVGTGPGLPGIPLAIMNPDKQFVLLDSLGKRITFLRQVVFQLKLENVKPVKDRVENFIIEQPFDGVLSRAFSSIHDMVTWCNHLISKEKGVFLALKGIYPQEELEQLPDGIVVKNVHTLHVPKLTGERHLVILEKNQ